MSHSDVKLVPTRKLRSTEFPPGIGNILVLPGNPGVFRIPDKKFRNPVRKSRMFQNSWREVQDSWEAVQDFAGSQTLGC